MYTIMREIHFCYGHRLMNYKGKCRHPHGHNGRVEIELTRPQLDKLGMVMDFEEIKKHLQKWIDEHPLDLLENHQHCQQDNQSPH